MKYRVKVIEVLLKNNTIGKYGEEFEENMFASSAASLEEGGYIEKASTKKTKDVDSGAEKDISTYTVEELKKALTDKEIQFADNALKPELIKLLKESLEPK